MQASRHTLCTTLEQPVEETSVPTLPEQSNSPDGSLVPAPVTARTTNIAIVRRGAAQVITLDRPRQRNALDIAMKLAMAAAIPKIARDANVYAIVLRASEAGAFCAGGDVREIARLAATEPHTAHRALAAEYELVWMLECFSKPVVSLVNGAVMGGGAGITLVNTHRVGGADYSFAMPEVQIGFFPDDGVAHVLSRMPGDIGTYLALTGRAINRADAFALGLVTHCIDAGHFDAIEAALGDAVPVDPLLDGLHKAPGIGVLEPVRPLIADCFGQQSIEAIMARLETMRQSGADRAAQVWAAGAIDDLARASPLALKIALRHLRDARAMDLRQTLAIDYRLAVRIVATHDFQEGVRALLVDKSGKPQWHPATASGISNALIAGLFQTGATAELILPTRAEMQAARI
jgi:enoyl-CoA hydratase